MAKAKKANVLLATAWQTRTRPNYPLRSFRNNETDDFTSCIGNANIKITAPAIAKQITRAKNYFRPAPKPSRSGSRKNIKKKLLAN
jgi:hypothetical protein